MRQGGAVHVLYLADDVLVSTIVDGGGAMDRRLFERAQPRDDEIAHRLRSSSRLRTRLVVDLADEAFELITVCARLRRDRVGLAQRDLDRRHPDTPFRFLRLLPLQRCLLAAVSRPAALSRWLERFDALKLPLVGVHSAALLGAHWAEEVAPGGSPRLAIWSLPTGALRLSALHAGVPMFTRLVPRGALDRQDVWWRAVAQEARRTAQYLADDGRWTASPEPAEAIVFAPPRARADLSVRLDKTSPLPFRVIGFDEVAHAAGLQRAQTLDSIDALIAAVLARSGTPNHYAPRHALRHASVLRARGAIGALSVTAAMSGIAASAWNLAAAKEAREAEVVARSRHVALSAEADSAAAAFPPLPASVTFLGELAALHAHVPFEHPGPRALLAPLSHVLASYPEVRLTQLAWHLSDNAQQHPALHESPREPNGALRSVSIPGAANVPRADAAVMPTGRLAIATLEGVMPPAGGDFAARQRRLENLVGDLSSLPGVHASILESPLDTGPSARLEGRFLPGETAAGRPRFRLHVTWQRDHAS